MKILPEICFFLLCTAIVPIPAEEEKKTVSPSSSSSIEGEKQEDGSIIFRRPGMGTLFTITVFPPDDFKENDLKRAIGKAWETLILLEKKASFFDAESELSQINRSPENTPIILTPELFALMENALQVAQKSNGAFDPTLGAYSRLWRRSVSRKILPTEEELAKAKAASGYRHVKLNSEARTLVKNVPGLLLDLGGLAKGAALDLMAMELQAHGIRRYRLSSTSDILVGDPPPGKKDWPLKVSDKKTPLSLKNAAVSTSGTTKQYVVLGGKRYSHLINPSTGLGTGGEIEVSVVAPSAAQADACATAALFMGNTPETEKKLGVTIVFYEKNDRKETENPSSS